MRLHTALLALALAFAGTVAPPPPAAAASPALAADSTRLHRDARRAQESFERLRETRIPAELREGGSRCQEPIGRFCLTHSSEDAEPRPLGPTPRDVVAGRAALLETLEAIAAEIPADDWVVGQRVRYLVEGGSLVQAAMVADACVATGWWCDALRGWVAHEDGRWVEAGGAFLDALEGMPEREREHWTGEEYLVERAGRSFLDVRDPAERERRRAMLWRLADPLFLVEGNDRWTAHMSRLAQARVMHDAWNPFGLPWDVDLEEVLIRYGWALSWERSRSTPSMPSQGRRIQPNVMVARLDPNGLRYLPTGDELAAFPDTDDGSLLVRSGREPTKYAPAYAPDFRNLRSQTARFRRDGELYVVHAFAPEPEAEREPPRVAAAPSDPFDRGRSDPFARRPEPDAAGEGADDAAPEAVVAPRDLRTALFILPVAGPVIEDRPVPVREGAELSGVWTVTVPDRDHIVSMEAWSPAERTAWRARRGLRALPAPEGAVSVSDPVFLARAGDDDVPGALEAALADVRPSLVFDGREMVRIAWEVYGIPEGSTASVALGLERTERSLARRIGEFFRVIEPPAPVVIRWDDGEPDRPGIVFRAIDLQLPSLDDGQYDLFLEIHVEGEPPAVTRRTIVIGDGGE